MLWYEVFCPTHIKFIYFTYTLSQLKFFSFLHQNNHLPPSSKFPRNNPKKHKTPSLFSTHLKPIVLLLKCTKEFNLLSPNWWLACLPRLSLWIPKLNYYRYVAFHLSFSRRDSAAEMNQLVEISSNAQRVSRVQVQFSPNFIITILIVLFMAFLFVSTFSFWWHLRDLPR